MIVSMVRLEQRKTRIVVARNLINEPNISPFQLASLMEETKVYDNQRSLDSLIQTYIRHNPYKRGILLFRVPEDKTLGTNLLSNEFEKLDYLFQFADFPFSKPLTRIEKTYKNNLEICFILEGRGGKPLSNIIKHSRETNKVLLKKVESILVETTFLISEIHKLGVIHGNLIPSNIFVNDEGVSIEGFEFSLFENEFDEIYNVPPIAELNVLLNSVKKLLEARFNKNMDEYISQLHGFLELVYLNTSVDEIA